MENTATELKVKKKIRSKIKNRYNWGALAIALQALGATILSTAGQFILAVIFHERVLADKTQIMANFMSLVLEYNMFITGITMIIVNVLVAVLVMKFSKTGKVRDLIKKPQISIIDICLGCASVLGIAAVDSYIIRLLSTIFGSTNEALGKIFGGGLESDSILVQVIAIAYIMFIGPVAEEILCRGAILPATSHISTKFGIFASALMFGLMHGNPTQLYNAFMMGLVLAYVTVKSKSLIPAMIMHVANNSWAVIEDYIPKSVTRITDIMIPIIGIAALVILIIRLKKVDDTKDELSINKPVTEEEKALLAPVKKGSLTFGSFFTCWGFWAVVGVELFNFLSILVMGNAMQ